MRNRIILLIIITSFTIFFASGCNNSETHDNIPAEDTVQTEQENSDNGSDLVSNVDASVEHEDKPNSKITIEKPKDDKHNKDNNKKEVIIEKTPPSCDHNYVEQSYSEPTCTKSGIKTFICSNCGNCYSEETSPPLGHAFGGWIIDENSHRRRCSRCQFEEVLGHNWKDDTCTVCGAIDFR